MIKQSKQIVKTYPEVDWELVHSQDFFTVENCWTTCNGGFCCSNNYHDFAALRFIPSKGTTIFYMEREYNYLFEKGKVHPGMARVLSLDFGAEKPLKFIYINCSHMGLCKGLFTPPLFCKLYPLLPMLSVEGNIEGLFLGSIYELTFQVREEKSPCTIEKECAGFYEGLGNAQPHLLQLLRHPYIILYARTAKAFADTYVKKLKSNKKLLSLNGQAFWEEWERQYLTGKLFDIDTLRRYVADTYEKLKQLHAGFSI